VTRHRFVALDGLRGVAALVVVAWHAGATRFIPGGYLAVDLFFVLSGFVLAYAFEDRLGWRTFMIARLKRLYPLYAAGMTVGALSALVYLSPDWRYWATCAAAVVMSPTPAQWGSIYRPYPFDTPAWSLFFELLVNAAWFALTPLLSNRLLGTILAGSGATLAYVIASSHGASVGDAGPLFLPLGFARAGFSFFAGVAGYRLWKVRPARWRPPAWMLAFAFLVPVMAPFPRGPVDAVAVLLIFPAVIWLGAGAAASGWVERVCETSGRASYAVYTLHAPLLAVAAFAMARYAPRLPHSDYLIALAGIPLMLIVGVSADRYLDAPLRALLAGPPARRRVEALD
jgi:peptidoglycan/LPS O-acetylase OafA/YrhL